MHISGRALAHMLQVLCTTLIVGAWANICMDPEVLKWYFNSCNMARVFCLICTPEFQRDESVHIRHNRSAHVTTIM